MTLHLQCRWRLAANTHTIAPTPYLFAALEYIYIWGGGGGGSILAFWHLRPVILGTLSPCSAMWYLSRTDSPWSGQVSVSASPPPPSLSTPPPGHVRVCVRERGVGVGWGSFSTPCEYYTATLDVEARLQMALNLTLSLPKSLYCRLRSL